MKGPSKRVHTTAHTEHLSTQTIVDLGYEKEPLSLVYPDLNPLKKRLFSEYVEGRLAEREDAETVQRNYRKKMMRYLDEKFEGKGTPIK
jgi:hypothetical protein